jgi:hypothetical protein
MSAADEVLGEQLRQEEDLSAVVKRSLVGIALSAMGIAFALLGLFVMDGISIELLGIILGGLGYYFGLQREDRLTQTLGITTIVLCVIALFVSGLTIVPQ